MIEILCGIYCLIEEVENKEGEIQKLIDWNII